MEYYSAIKRNEIELLVVRWMDLESVIQSEVKPEGENTVCLHVYMESKKKEKGSEEPRDRTGIKMQTWRMDLRARGGGRVSWDQER